MARIRESRLRPIRVRIKVSAQGSNSPNTLTQYHKFLCNELIKDFTIVFDCLKIIFHLKLESTT